MSITQQIKTNNTKQSAPQKTSLLENFSLGFEYNKMLPEIKREVRARRI